LIKWNKLSKRRAFLYLLLGIVTLVILFQLTGSKKIKSDISRVIHNSMPKIGTEVYSTLFKKPTEDCINIINLKDQVIPKIECCIWMEVKLCPAELQRIVNQKKYKETRYGKQDSVKYLGTFTERPEWWTPQVLGDSLIKLNIRFDAENEQTLFFDRDSSHLFLCDQAL